MALFSKFQKGFAHLEKDLYAPAFSICLDDLFLFETYIGGYKDKVILLIVAVSYESMSVS